MKLTRYNLSADWQTEGFNVQGNVFKIMWTIFTRIGSGATFTITAINKYVCAVAEEEFDREFNEYFIRFETVGIGKEDSTIVTNSNATNALKSFKEIYRYVKVRVLSIQKV